MTPTLNYRKRWITLDSGDKRYLGDDGALKKGEWFLISGKDSRDADYNYWYYAGSDGNVVMDKWQRIDGQYYCFNASGVMRTGWQYLEIPESWSDDEDVEDYISQHGTDYAWFYFNRNGKKKYSSSGVYYA